MEWLFALNIDKPGFLVLVCVVTTVCFAYLLCRGGRRRFLLGLGVTILGALLGLILVWLVSDVWNVFGIALSPVVHLWTVFIFAGLFLAVSNFWASRWWRKTVASVSILVFLVAASAGINIDFGAYRNLNDAFGISRYPDLPGSRLTASAGVMDASLAKSWNAREHTGIPTQGMVGMVTIPATQSRFVARKAAVYLPPAALVANPPVLPLLVLFSGQPGSPSDMFSSGQISIMLDAYAAKHAGLAPIVVVPDPLGTPLKNPMCADSQLSKASTYLTEDVRAWVLSHLHVADHPRYWAVGGYSAGGTCSIQLGAGRPDLFGTALDILGEVIPTIGDKTLGDAFGGSRSAYDAIKPLNLLAANAPYRDSVAFFGAGAKDQLYAARARQVEAAAAQAGMKTRLIIAPSSGHDWNTVRYVLSQSLPAVCARLGLGS